MSRYNMIECDLCKRALKGSSNRNPLHYTVEIEKHEEYPYHGNENNITKMDICSICYTKLVHTMDEIGQEAANKAGG